MNSRRLLHRFLSCSPLLLAIAAAAADAPASWLSTTADLRVRNEYFNRAVTLADTALGEQDVLRFRSRVSFVAQPLADFTLAARISAEPRVWVNPAFVGACKARTGTEWRFAAFEGLSAKWTKLLGQPLTLTIGRQDVLLGDLADAWLMVDGTPGDGSWTLYLDAARLTWDIADAHTKVDIVAIAQSAAPDRWLPTLGNSASYPVTDQDERGLIFNVSNKSIPNTQLDAYVVYKHDARQTFTIAGVQKTPGDDADLGTVGGRITGALGGGWTYCAEAAWQFGTKADRVSGTFARRDVRAYGGKARLTRALDDTLHSQLTFSGEMLSGDDPSTPGRDEMFDILWGRWPRWSELYIYSYINETGGRIAQLNNLGRLGATWAIAPVKGTTASLTYQSLFALEATPTRNVAPTLFSREGHFRGHHVQAFVKHQFNRTISGHVWFEAVRQGDFYTHRETMTFFRTELMFAF